MTTIFTLFLFILQLISFYFIALLYTKVSKFDDLEKKQRKLMDEMDDSIGAYLSELKDENDRLIEKLTTMEQVNSNKKIVEKNTETSIKPHENKTPTIKVPINLALKSYAKTSLKKHEDSLPDQEPDERSQIIRLHENGHSVEEIAKKLGKGKTEIELIIKFS